MEQDRDTQGHSARVRNEEVRSMRTAGYHDKQAPAYNAGQESVRLVRDGSKPKSQHRGATRTERRSHRCRRYSGHGFRPRPE